jgi:hypothetical protein
MTKIIYRVEVEDGNTSWYNEKGQVHREDGPAFELADGTKYWYRNNQYHREDGPAIEYADGSKHWFRNGQFHREDGPAVEYADGSKSWYLDGKKLTEKEFLKRNQKQPSCDGKVVEIDGKKYKLVEI